MEAIIDSQTIVERSAEPLSRSEQTLRLIDEEFTGRKVDYYVIGSAARIAYLGQSPNLVTDFDILTPAQSQKEKAAEALTAVIGRIDQSGLHSYVDTTLSQFLVEDGGGYHLKYGRTDHKIDTRVMEKRRVKLGESEFTTLAPETLLHTYSFVGGPFREKDWPHAMEFARFVKNNPEEFGHELFEPFHNFSKERWNGYPIRKLQYLWRGLVKKLPANLKNDLLEGVYPNSLVRGLRSGLNKLNEVVCLR